MTLAANKSTSTYTPPPPRPSLSPDIEWRENELGELAPFVRGTTRQIIWAPQPGSQEAFLTCPIFETLYEGSRGGGKALPNDTPVLTPLGFRRHGSLRRGQSVITPSGRLAKVTHVFDRPQEHCYRITFDDGAEITASEEHIWKFRVVGSRRKARDNNYHWDDTREMLRHFRAGHAVLIPTVAPLPMPRHPRLKQFPLDPYLLGLLLGDGGLTQATNYCTVDAPLADYVLSQGFTEYAESRNGLRNFRGPLPVWNALKKLKLAGKRSHEKHVPRIYKFAPLHVRLAILQGLMDTDGTADAEGRISFCSTSLQLARDVQWIARSMGAKATLTRKIPMLAGVPQREAHGVYIQPAGKFAPFRLSRKQERVTGYMHEELCRRITDIQPAGKIDCTCIRIDDEEHLYVATEDFIVTHNTDTLLMDFAQHVGKGFGAEWRGVLFRKTYPELQDVVEKAKKWFPRIWPGSGMHETKHQWEWETGERLLFRHADKPSDYWKYHGSSFPWLAWEELTTWANLDLYTSMMSICRSTVKAIPRKYRATTNPYGPGHNVVKARFKLPLPPSEIIHRPLTDERGQQRVAIRSNVYENRVLLHADPGYIARIAASAPNPAALRAWLEGNWDVVAGGMIDDVWVPSVHIIPNVSPDQIPAGWRIDRSYDHGQSRPFSVGWWAESDGTPIQLQKTVFTPHGPTTTTVTVGEVQGDLVRIAEWYGCSGEPNKGLNLDPLSEIAPGIRSREESLGIARRVRPGPADTAIYDSYSPGRSVAGDMKKGGVTWTRADKGPGSRKQGWQQIRRLLRGALGLGDEAPVEEFHREPPIIDPATGLPVPRPRKHPGMWVCERCTDFVRTVPALPRDDKDPDDVDTRSEDHIGDEVRYRVRRRSTDVKQRNF